MRRATSSCRRSKARSGSSSAMVRRVEVNLLLVLEKS
jgi:hypothetical protein